MFVGRLSAEKGPSLLLDSLNVLGRLEPVVFVGSGPEEEFVRRRAVELGIGAEFVGEVSQAVVKQMMSQARLVVVPSVPRGLQQEGSGIAVLEAMACGTPVVVTRVGGLPENMPPVLSRLIGEPTSDSLAAAIDEALNSGWEELSRQSRAHVLAHHSLDRLAHEYRTLYTNMLEEQPGISFSSG